MKVFTFIFIFAAMLKVSAQSTNLVAGQSLISVGSALTGTIYAGGGGGPTPDLLWYKFDEGSGTTINDSSVAANTGTASLATWTTGPNSNGALSFNGTSTSVAMTSAVSLVGSSFSFSCWVNLAGSSSRTILGFTNGSGAITIRLNSAATISLVADKIAVLATSTSAVSAGWHEVGMSLDTSGNYTFYIDGSSAGSGTVSRSSLTINPNILGNASGINWFNGSLDDLRIYSSVLTGSDFAAIYSAGAQ